MAFLVKSLKRKNIPEFYLQNEVERDQITIAMKVDVESKMGIVSDVQQELREANARKVLYSSLQTIDI